ncbi:MAG TPA: glutathione S-transferase family protein [Caulobacteraceae bacterium]|jgi:glutathione S-transferase|nr:glutathione S-transferase family protein [Caulobacteraceae bacterium]
MVAIHHLNNSRSQRILWLLEELGAPYEIKFYQRDATSNLAPPELKAVHPLGKSPVIQDGDLKIAESGAAVDYLIRTYGGGRFQPAAGTADHERYLEWLHYAEGSGMLPPMLRFYTLRLGDAGEPLKDRIDSEANNHLGYIESELSGRPYLMGDDLTGADIQMSFVGEVGRALGYLADKPNTAAWVGRMHERPAFKRALEKGGAYNLA